MDEQSHWDNIYRTKAADEVSWFRPHLEVSLSLIAQTAPSRDQRIIDIGGGESSLVDDLLARGYENISVLDISSTAIEQTKARLGEASKRVQWICADITEADLPSARYDLWHDRAVFHFLIRPEQRAAYIRQAVSAVRPAGHVIVSTFGPEGPVKCSGLDVVRYDTSSLHDEFGSRFRLVGSTRELHQTPFGTTQQFLYCWCIVE